MRPVVRAKTKRLKTLLMNGRQKKESLWHVSVLPYTCQTRLLSLNLYLENSF